MLETLLWLAAAFALIFVINIVPAFMPSSWMVMAFFYIQFDLPLLALTLGGAIASACGRFVLARGSSWVKRTFLRQNQRDLDELGAFLNEHNGYLAPTAFIYALTPLPTNNLFVAAGLAEARLMPVLAGFVVARMIADTVFVWTTHRVFGTIADVFRGAAGNWLAIALQIAGVVSIVLLYKLPWARWLRRWTRPKVEHASNVT